MIDKCYMKPINLYMVMITMFYIDGVTDFDTKAIDTNVLFDFQVRQRFYHGTAPFQSLT